MIPKTPIIIASTIAIATVSVVAIAAIQRIKQESRIVYKEVPAYEFDRCYPSMYERPQSVRFVKAGGVTWWEVVANSTHYRGQAAFLHVKTDGKKCIWKNRYRKTFRLDYMPKNVAINFAEQQFKPMLELCKKKNVNQKNLDAYCREEMRQGLKESSFFPEEVIALKSLGIDSSSIQGSKIIATANDIK